MAAPSLKKTVEIALQITNADPEHIKAIASAFGSINTSVNKAATGLGTFKTNLGDIKYPPKLDKFVEAFTKLGGAKIPNLESLATGFSKLEKMKAPPDLAKFAEELKKFAGIKLPNLNAIALGFANFNKMGTPVSLNPFVTELQKLQALKIPNIAQISVGLKGISDATVNMVTVGGRLRVLARNLKDFKDIKIPNLASLSLGLKKLTAQTIDPTFSPKMTLLANELKKFAGIKLPNITSISTGLTKLIKLDVAKVVDTIRRLNLALDALNKSGGANAFAVFVKQAAGMQTAFKAAANATTQLTNAIRQTGNASQSSGLQLDGWMNKVRTILQFRIISAVLQNINQAFMGGVDAIFDYDQALKDLQAITNATDLEVFRMGETIREVASSTKFSASEVAEGMRIISQAGFTASESIQTMQAVSDLATGTLSTMAETVELVTTAMRVFNIDATDSARVADVFANAANGSKLTIEKLSTAFNYVGPVAKDAGVTFEELAASMMALSNSGIRASTIGTSLRQILSELVDPSDKLKEAASKAGIALNELNPATTNMQDVLSNLKLVITDTGVAFDIFGKRGASAILALTSENNQYADMLAMTHDTGTAARQAAKQMEGLNTQFKNLKDKLGLLSIALGDGFIVSALKSMLLVSRNLVDGLIVLASTLMGKLVVALGAVTVAVFAFSMAWGGITFIGQSQVFLAMAASAARFATSLGLTTMSVRSFIASLGPMGLTLSFISVAMLLISGKSKETAQDLQAVGASYLTLKKKLQDYSLSVVGMAEGSDELKAANLNLRKSLLEISSEMGDVSQEALLAALSIKPLTGEINDGSKALDAYNKKLDEIHLKKFADSAKLMNAELESSGSYFNRTLNSMSTSLFDLTNVGKTFSFDFGFRKEAAEADIFAQKISEGNVSLKTMKDTIDSWDSKNLTTQQKVIKDNYEYLIEKAQLFANDLVATNRIDLSGTSEYFRKTASDAGYAGIVLNSIVEILENLKTKAEVPFKNVIEKWSYDGITAISEFATEYEKLGGVFEKGEKKQISLTIGKQNELVADLARLKERREAEEKAGVDIYKTWEDFYRDQAELILKANKIQASLSENGAYQNIKLILLNRKNLAEELERIAIEQDSNEQERARKRQVAISENAVKEKRLLEGSVVDPKEQDRLYETSLENRKAIHENHLSEIAILEAKGVLTHEQAERNKNEATLRFYEESFKQAQKYFKAVEQEDPSTVDYTKRKTAMLNAEKDYYTQLTAITKDYNDLVLTRDKDITKATRDAADKILDINTKLQEKLDKLALEKKEKDRQTLADRIIIEADGADAIRKINQEGMTEDAKMYSDRDAAYQKLADATKLISEAGVSGDLQKLKAGEALIKQSQTLGQGLENQAMAVDLVKKATAALLQAKDSEKEIKDLEDIRLKNEEIAKVVKERNEVESEKEKKIKAANDVFTAQSGWETIRHETESSNLDNEISKYREKLQLAKDIAEVNRQVAANIASASSDTSDAKFATGGSVFKRLSSPLITTGSDKYDSVKALLMKGEFVQPISAVNKYGVKFMEMIRRGVIPLKEASKFALGGIVGPEGVLNHVYNVVNNNNTIQRFASGGGVGIPTVGTKINSQKSSNNMTLNFAFGNKVYPVNTSTSIANGLIGELKKIQRNMI